MHPQSIFAAVGRSVDSRARERPSPPGPGAKLPLGTVAETANPVVGLRV